MKRCPNSECEAGQFPDEANFCPSCAQRLVPDDTAAATGADAPASEALGGRFTLGERMGGNRTGEIYAATDGEGGGECVVKLVHAAVFPTPLLKQRTERELKQLERVNAPAICKLLGHGNQGDRLWIASERVAGQSLKVLVSSGKLDVDRARTILLAIGGALAEAAKVGVIHRDVSPKNVLVADGDQVKLINFGVCTPLTESVQGEPEFLSPEQCDGKPVDQRSNIYSLGAMFYYMVTGQPPYTGDAQTVMQAHRDGNLTPPSRLGAVPPAIETIIVKALETTSSKRFMTLRQMLGDVERADTTGAADSASSTNAFPGAAPAARPAAAQTMMGMIAPGTGDGPVQVVPVMPAPASQPPVAAQPPAPAAQPTPQPAAQPQPTPQPAAQPAPGPQPTPQPKAAVVVAKEPMPAPTNGAAPVSAAPEPAPPAPQIPAPQVPAPSVPPQAAGAGKAGGKRAKSAEQQQEPSPKRDKGKFRETLWFKKGELDAVAAEAAAAAAAQGQADLVSDKADEMLIEDRYTDDGTVTQQDKKAYSLRTGHTQMMQAVQDAGPVRGGMGEDDLVSEMKAGRGKIIAAIAIGLGLTIAVVLAFVL